SEGTFGLAGPGHKILLELHKPLDRLMPLTNRLDHRLFGQLTSSCLNHHDRVARTSYGQIQQAIAHTRHRWVDGDFAIQVADIDRAAGARKRDVRERECG